MTDPQPKPPCVFISYSHDSPEHASAILALADRLRRDGLDALIDQYEAFPKEGWIAWMRTHLREARWVLMVCTQTYRSRFEGDEKAGIGLGASFETGLIEQLLYNERGINEKFLPIVLHPEDRQFVPLELQRYRLFMVDNEAGYEALYRLLTDQPRTQTPILGTLRALPPLARSTAFLNATWNLPYARNAFFSGRERALEALHAALTNPATDAIVQVLSGLGGVGKSQLVIEYAYRHRHEYDAILWTGAESISALTKGFVQIARLLDLPEAEDPDQTRAVEAVKESLCKTSRWLLVFDNADKPEVIGEILNHLLPDNPGGRILLTSRLRDVDHPGLALPIIIEEFSLTEAREFLLKRADRLQASGDEVAAAEALATELGCLPLALEQAGAYIRANQARFQDYLDGYRKRALELLEKKNQ